MRTFIFGFLDAPDFICQAFNLQEALVKRYRKYGNKKWTLKAAQGGMV